MSFPLDKDRFESFKKPFSWLKRLLFMSPDAAAERMIATQDQEAVRSLQESMRTLTSSNDVTRERIETIFQERIQALQRNLQPLKDSAGDSTVLARLQTVETTVTNRLNDIKANVLSALDRLGVTDRTTQLQQQYRERFQTFLNVTLQLEGMRANIDAPAARTPETREQPVEVPGTREFNRVWNWHVDQWQANDNIGGWFSLGFFYPLSQTFIRNNVSYRGQTGLNAARVFAADKLGGMQTSNPNNEMKNIVKHAHDIFLAYLNAQRRAGRREPELVYRREFLENGLSVDLNGRLSHTNPAIQRLITSRSSAQSSPPSSPSQSPARRPGGSTARPEAARLQQQARAAERAQLDRQAQQAEQPWQQEVARRPEVVNRDQENATLTRLESNLNRGEVPSREDLMVIQTLINRTQNEVLGGTQIKWEDVDQAHMYNGSYNRERGITSTPRLQIAGKNLDLSSTFQPFNPTQQVEQRRHSLLGVQHPDGHVVDVDVPRLLRTLEHISTAMPWLTKDKKALNLGEISQQVQSNPEQVRERLNRARYRQLLKDAGVSEGAMERYQNIPRSLARLLRLSDLNVSRTPQQWKQALEGIEYSNTISPDEYKFLWVMRHMVRSRRLEGSTALNLEGFSNQLLSTRPYVSLPDSQQVNTVGALLRQNITEATNTTPNNPANLIVAQRKNAAITRENQRFLQESPAIQNIFQFLQLFKERSGDTGNADLFGENVPLSEVTRLLDLAVDMPVTMYERGKEYVVIDHTVTGQQAAQLKISKVLVDRYKDLLQTNGFFRDLVEIGRASRTRPTDAHDHNLENSVMFLFTPNQATPERFLSTS